MRPAPPRSSRRWVGCAVMAASLLIAGCAALEAQKKRLAADPLFAGRSKAGAADPTPTASPAVTAAKAPAAAATPGPIEKARAAIDAISADDERALGEAVALRIIASTLAKTVPAGEGTRPSTGLELRDQALLAYVSHVGNLVALHGRRQVFPPATKPRMKARRFAFGVLDTAEVGAYSVPGGYIFVTRGLLQKLTSESELAWVLGHEIAHVDWEDGLAALKADIGTKAFVGAFAEAFKPRSGTATSADPMRDQAAFNAVADRFYELYEGTGLARETEQRADAIGLEYSTAAGYDGQGAARALDALAPPENAPGTIKLGRAFGDSINRFLTHGSKRERMAEMAAHLQKPGRTGAARYDRIALARIEQLASRSGGAK